MKHISTLIVDIYDTIKQPGWLTEEMSQEFSRELGLRLVEATAKRDEVPTLRLSQMGKKCPSQLWHSIHTPELAEPLPPWARIKYTYGHIIECYIITAAKAAGHEVTGEQDELWLDGIRGHRDCVIDGNIVDVKSCSTFSFQKFKDGSIRDDDAFGYLDQLDGYLLASRDDPLVRNKSSAYLLAVDKQLGHLCLYEHKLREDSIIRRIAEYKDIVAKSESPHCGCGTIPDGASGNIRLDVRGSYNPFKWCCRPELRCFLYANGPKYLTKVVRKPDVPEINREGKIIYG